MVVTESLGFAPVHSARFAMIPSVRHVSAETEANPSGIGAAVFGKT